MSIASSASGLYSSVNDGWSTSRAPPCGDEAAAGAADDAEAHVRRGSAATSSGDARTRRCRHVAARGDRRRRRRRRPRAPRAGRAHPAACPRCRSRRRRARRARDRATDDHGVPAAHRLGDDVAAGVAGASDDGDASHGLPFDGVSAKRSARFIPACMRYASTRAQRRHLVQRDGCRDPGVERLGGRRDRDRDDLVARLGDQAREPLALGADDDHDRAVGQLEARAATRRRRRRGRARTRPAS